MSSLRPPSAPFRLGALLLLALGVLGVRFAWTGLEGALWFQADLGYGFTLALVAVWLVLFARVGGMRGWFTRGFWRGHTAALVLVAGATVFLHLHEPHLLRVFYDEPSHALGAMVMHSEKTALMADRSHWVGDQFVLSGFHTSFRQYLFPFLVSLLHDLTGYRVANVFVLNFLLTPVVLLGAYFLGWRLAGRLAGLVAAGLLGTLPLLAQVATSGSYDLLNVALLGGLLLLTAAYLGTDPAAPGRERLLDLGLATVLLLSMARAESILYLLPWGGAVLYTWLRERRATVTAFAIVSPLFLLPNLMMNAVLMAGEQGLHGGLRAGGASYFSLGYLPAHLAETVHYLFNFDHDSTNSVLLSAAGLLGLVGLLVRVAGHLRARTLRPVEGWVAVAALAVGAVYLLVLAQFWSSPADPAAARFSLPLLFVGAVLGGWMVTQAESLRGRPALVATALVLWAVAAAAPAMARATRTHGMTMAWCEQWFLAFAAQHGRERVIYLERSNYPLMAHRFASADLGHLGDSPAAFVRAVKAGLYREAVVFQVLETDPATGAWSCKAGHAVPPHVVLETLDERVMAPGCLARISRLVGYRKADGTVVTPASDDPEVALRRSFAHPGEALAYRASLYP